MLTLNYTRGFPTTTKLPRELISFPSATVHKTKVGAEDAASQLKRNGMAKRTRILHRYIPVFGARVEVWVVAAWN